MTFFAQMPLVISYYTKGTPYEKEVEHLIESCKKFQIEHCIEGVEDLGSWEKNCARKPEFIRQKMEEHKRPLLWVDADAVFLQPMQFEKFMFFDCSVVKYTEEIDIRFCVAAGTVYINATQGGQEALFLWCKYADSLCKDALRPPPFVDQVSLYLTFRTPSDIAFSLLPLRYCKIFDMETKNIGGEDIVIEHRQASRRFKKI